MRELLAKSFDLIKRGTKLAVEIGSLPLRSQILCANKRKVGVYRLKFLVKLQGDGFVSVNFAGTRVSLMSRFFTKLDQLKLISIIFDVGFSEFRLNVGNPIEKRIRNSTQRFRKP